MSFNFNAFGHFVASTEKEAHQLEQELADALRAALAHSKFAHYVHGGKFVGDGGTLTIPDGRVTGTGPVAAPAETPVVAPAAQSEPLPPTEAPAPAQQAPQAEVGVVPTAPSDTQGSAAK